MKRIISVLLAALCLIGLCACKAPYNNTVIENNTENTQNINTQTSPAIKYHFELTNETENDELITCIYCVFDNINQAELFDLLEITSDDISNEKALCESAGLDFSTDLAIVTNTSCPVYHSKTSIAPSNGLCGLKMSIRRAASPDNVYHILADTEWSEFGIWGVYFIYGQQRILLSRSDLFERGATVDNRTNGGK